MFFVLLWLSCQRSNKTELSVIESEAKIISDIITQIDSKAEIDSLISLGLYNLAFESFNNNLHSFRDAEKTRIARCFIDNGEFDKGLSIVNLLETNKSQYDMLQLKLLCALNKQDNALAKQFLDSIVLINEGAQESLKSTELKLLRAYYAHNTKNYQQAIELNEEAIFMIDSFQLPSQLLALVYHRLGNSYNDIVRDKIPFDKPYKYCYEKGMEYYNKELNILFKSKHRNRTRIALNYITTAMLKRANKSFDELPNYYRLALNELIVYQNSNTLLTRNAVYTSIALSQFGGYYYDKGIKKPMDSLFGLNSKLIATRSLYRVNNNESLDIWEYFSQRSEELKMLFRLKHQNIDSTALVLLSLGNNCKYANLNLHKSLQAEFSTQTTIALNNWILLMELNLYAAHSKNKSILNYTERLLPKYQEAISSILSKNKTTFNNTELKQLKDFCKKNNSCIIDYQVLYGGSILISIINEDKLELKWIVEKETVSAATTDSLLNAIKTNDIENFKRFAKYVTKELGLNNFKNKNLVISPDEHLEKIPFEALLQSEESGNSWSNQCFLANLNRIQLVPNLSVILGNWVNHNPLFIDIWTSDHDNQTLPYNQKLIEFLTDKYRATSNSKSPKQILQVLAHTYKTSDGEIEFRLNSDTLNINSNIQVSPNLAILVGCSSGGGKNYKLEGSISLTRNFLYRGTPTVIYSIWDADNQASSELFKHFYTYLSNGFTISESLARAKNDIRTNILHPEWSNPFYWANFQVTGKEGLFN